jgi:hypothetical protein
MTYQPFIVGQSARVNATVATVATVPPFEPQSVAVVATVARGEPEDSAPTFAIVAGVPPKIEDLDAHQEAAERRNREAALSGLSDRWCACGTMATVAVGHFRPSRGNPEGVARWLCSTCFSANQRAE